jgi:hypothetical protein
VADSPRSLTTDLTKIYFSDFFDVPPSALEEYGAFDVSLLTDLPLFIDPFLLFNSDKPEYRDEHEKIIEYVKFLRDKAVARELDDTLVRLWFTFPEVKQNWFGYTEGGNSGSGLGIKFARALNANLNLIFSRFGKEDVTKGSHLEKVLLFSSGVGRDNISDFVTNVLKDFLLRYTERFTLKHVKPEQRRKVTVRKAVFDYDTESWASRSYTLPFIEGDYVVLTPVDILTKDEVWINRTDMVRNYPEIAASIPDAELRGQMSNYFEKRLREIREREAENKRRRTNDAERQRLVSPGLPPATQKQQDEAAGATIHAFPGYTDYYVKYKEDHGDEAEALADERVRSSQQLYIAQVRDLVALLRAQSDFYAVEGVTFEEARKRAHELKGVVEQQRGWRMLYADGEPISREPDLRLVTRLVWTNSVDGENGAVLDNSVVEFKLARNAQIRTRLEQHVEAGDGTSGLTVLFYFTDEERERVMALLKALKVQDRTDIVLIDGRGDGQSVG